MRVFVFVNDLQEIGFRQTTALLIASLHRQGHEVFLANVSGLSVSGCCTSVQPKSSREEQNSNPTFLAMSIRLKLNSTGVTSQHVANFACQTQDSHFAVVEITSQDLIFIRTNPGRDLANRNQHEIFLEVCQVASYSGIQVINDPAKLNFFASKAAVLLMPSEYRPEMLVTQNLESVLGFVKNANRPCVVKPLLGSRGEDVIRLDGSANSERELGRFKDRTIVVQHFVDSDEPGDKRVVVFGGKILEHEGHLAGIHRVPAEGDFRANLHAGGSAKPLSLSKDQRLAISTAVSILQDAGIYLAGVDLIGTKVIEFNVFSTGGLYDANQFSNLDFSDMVVAELFGPR